MIAMLVMVSALSTPLVTGNGFGYAVVDAGAVTRLYAHPYRFMRMKDDSVDGVPTSNLIRRAEWTGDDSPAAVSYVSESHVIRAQKRTLTAEFFQPFALQRNVLMTTSNAGCFAITWEHPVKSTRKLGTGATLYSFAEISEHALVVAMADTKATCPHSFAVAVLERAADAAAALREVTAWKGSGATEIAALEAWRVPTRVTNPAERTLWRQSETILRMAQIREPQVYGLINASLPNGNWFIPWVRDGSFAIVGLVRMGHRAEARAALNAWFNMPATSRRQHDMRDVPYQIATVRYFGDGTDDADKSGTPNQNLEFDSWGLALWAMGEYVTCYNDRAWLDGPATHGTVFTTARDYVVKPILANTDPYGDGIIMTLDSSCWEQNNQPRQHYAYSTIAVIQGLRAFRRIAELHGDDTTELARGITRLEKGFNAAYVRDGVVYGVLGDQSPKNAMDGALVEGIADGVITAPQLVASTMQRLAILKTGSGGYRRVTGTSEYESHEFILIDYAAARAYLRLGQRAKAEAIAAPIVARALADHGFIPEMAVSFPSTEYPGAIGDPAGAVPMVGYGPGAFMIYVSERDEDS